jgi:hypothetical protein
VLLAWVALVFGVLALAIAPAGVLALGLGLATQVLARRDVEAMRAGLMDPEGHGHAERARNVAACALGLALFGGLLCGVPLLTAFLRSL